MEIAHVQLESWRATIWWECCAWLSAVQRLFRSPWTFIVHWSSTAVEGSTQNLNKGVLNWSCRLEKCEGRRYVYPKACAANRTAVVSPQWGAARSCNMKVRQPVAVSGPGERVCRRSAAHTTATLQENPSMAMLRQHLQWHTSAYCSHMVLPCIQQEFWQHQILALQPFLLQIFSVVPVYAIHWLTSMAVGFWRWALALEFYIL